MSLSLRKLADRLSLIANRVGDEAEIAARPGQFERLERIAVELVQVSNQLKVTGE